MTITKDFFKLLNLPKNAAEIWYRYNMDPIFLITLSNHHAIHTRGTEIYNFSFLKLSGESYSWTTSEPLPLPIGGGGGGSNPFLEKKY